MTDVVVVPGTNVGGTLLGFLLQALSWLAFGFCFAAGWMLLAWIVAKLN